PEEELDGDAVSAPALDVTSGLPASMVDVVSVEICVSEPPREELDDEGKLISTLELDAKPDEAGLTVDVVSVEVCVSACPREEATDEVELVSTLSLDVEPGVAGMLVVVVPVEICVSGAPSEEADAEVKLVSTLPPDVKPGVTVVGDGSKDRSRSVAQGLSLAAGIHAGGLVIRTKVVAAPGGKRSGTRPPMVDPRMWPSRLIRRDPSDLFNDCSGKRLNLNRTALNWVLDLSVGYLQDWID
ncbi:hypothetical protein KC346_g19583, partial [Hortaea werneckii]